MTKTWSFMIFVFHLYSAEAFGVWGDANHYICIWSFLVVLVNWGNLAYAMMSYFSRPTIQSCFGRFAAICKKLCCRSFVLLCNCAVLWFAPSALLCGFLWFDLCLLLLISCNACYQGYEKGWGLSSLSQPWWFSHCCLSSLSQTYFHLCTFRPLDFTVNTSDCN